MSLNSKMGVLFEDARVVAELRSRFHRNRAIGSNSNRMCIGTDTTRAKCRAT
ncbi:MULTISPECIES: hypothetical protein [unclassified Mesorhizobium]|uniref:hypothetical protein n=1 Tax=unclassified Mesorhizobium TaxID=325217 RepID=UPI001FEFF278|nr:MULTISPECIES: hypothetical protein [unclassified Mesorhizobium]